MSMPTSRLPQAFSLVLLALAGCGEAPKEELGPTPLDEAAVGKETTQEHCDGEDNDSDGSIDEGCGTCDWMVTRGRAFWTANTCVLTGGGTGVSLLPVTSGGTTYTTASQVTSYLNTPAGTNALIKLGQQLLVARFNVAVFEIGDVAYHDWNGDGTVETVDQLVTTAAALYTSGTNTQRNSMATLLQGLNADGESFGLWFDRTCVASPEICNGVDDDGDGSTDESCACHEVCDGYDNDFDGVTDPGCDDPPSAPGVTLSAVAEASGTEGLQCVIGTPSVDPEGGAVTYTVSWLADGEPYTTAETLAQAGDYVRNQELARATEWSCSVTASDGANTSDPGTATQTLSGPQPGGYAFETVAVIPYASDLAILPDGTALVASLYGEIYRVDLDSGAVLGQATAMAPEEEMVSMVIHPDFGDGSHDWVYAWSSKSADLYRFDVDVSTGFSITATTVVDDMTFMSENGHCGGGLLFWSGETGEDTLYVGTGPMTGADAQVGDNPGQKLLAYDVNPVTGAVTGAALDASFSDDRVAALGVRNGWRISDCGAAICLADPGNSTFEELNLYTGAGMNFGHPEAEGPSGGVYDDAFYWWGDDEETQTDEDYSGSRLETFENVPWVSSRFTGTGYGGRLADHVFFGDFFDGWIRAQHIDDDGNAVGDTIPVAHLQYVMKMAEASDGTIYVVELGGSLRRLVFRGDLPRAADLGSSIYDTPYTSATAYTPRYQLWSNGATKVRRVWIPSGTTIDNTVEPWIFPDGTWLFKDFTVGSTLVETRVLVKDGDDWIPGVYLWNDGATDALLSDGYTLEDPTVTTSSGAAYTVPSVELCSECHQSERGAEWPLSMTPYRLGNTALSTLTPMLASGPASAPEVSGTSNTKRVRGYLDVNCSFCHDADGIASQVTLIEWHLDYEATMDTSLQALYYHANPNLGIGDPIFDVTNPGGSVLYRVIRNHEMPPIGVWETDNSILSSVRTWIAAGAP